MLRLVRSSAAALAAGSVALSIVALFLFAAPLWYGWRQTIEAGRGEILQDDSQQLTNIYQNEGIEKLIDWINARINMQFEHGRTILLTDSRKQPLAGNLTVWPSDIPDAPGWYGVDIKFHNVRTRMFFVHSVLPGGYHLLMGRDVSRLEPLETAFWYGLAMAMASLVVVGVIGTLLIRRVMLSPIQGISQASTALVAGDLKRRLPVPGATAELDALSRTINGLLDQIEKLIHGVRNVSNSIAHDLRTPLTELRSRLEELVLTKPAADETFSEIDGAVTDVDRVIRVFDALLRLAEIDTGARRAGFVEVDLAELTSEAVEFYLPAAELRNVELVLGQCDAATIRGDTLLLAQAIGNLIDNALKFVPNKGHIVVSVLRGSDGIIRISIADDGPGIPDHEKPKVTERFYRGDVSRGTPGTGLGLSLVEAVAVLHEGRLDLADNAPGLRATMLLRSKV
ncbi:MAG TPA: ATP-binding protein [Dongiaceae bacterium]|nr:ATP-binding protein [Dongiaceae bacterium]